MLRAVIAVLLFVSGLAAGVFAEKKGFVHRARIAAETTVPQLLAERGDVVMIGDSITASGDWKSLLPGRKIVNQGVPSFTTKSALSRVRLASATKASRAFVMLGVNDLRQGAAVDEVFSRYSALIDALASSVPSVVVQSTLLTSDFVLNRAISELNRRLAERCQAGSCLFVDLNKTLAPDGLLGREFTTDGIHLTPAAYFLWAQRLHGIV